MLHLNNDNPHADGIDLDATPLATSGQTVQLHLSDANGALFDSDQAAHINRSFAAGRFSTATWNISDGVHSMVIDLQFVTIKDDGDAIFSDGFGG